METAAQGHQLAHRGGAAWRAAPFKSRAEMDAKTRELVLLAALALFCASVAWSEDHAIFAVVFAALSAVAAFNAAAPRPR